MRSQRSTSNHKASPKTPTFHSKNRRLRPLWLPTHHYRPYRLSFKFQVDRTWFLGLRWLARRVCFLTPRTIPGLARRGRRSTSGSHTFKMSRTEHPDIPHQHPILSRMPLYCKFGVIVGVSVAKPRVPWVHAGCVRVRGHACTPYCSHAHSTCAQFQLPPVKPGQGQVDQPFHWWLHRIMGNGQHAHALGDPCGVWEHGRDHGISHAIPPARVDRNVQLCFWRGNLVGASC